MVRLTGLACWVLSVIVLTQGCISTIDISGSSSDSPKIKPAAMVPKVPAKPAALKEVKILDFLTLYETVATDGKESESVLKLRAEQLAVKSCAGRLYLGDKLLIAEDLLNKYLDTYANTFISESHMTEREERKDQVYQTWRVVVAYGKLRDDLHQKRFVYEPKYRPWFAVLFQEQKEKEPTRSAEARANIIKKFEDNGLRVRKDEFLQDTSNLTDYMALTKSQQRDLRIELMRNGVEVLVTGNLNITDKGDQSIYLVDDFYYNDATMDLNVIRVNDGRVLYKISDRIKYSDRSVEASIKNSTRVLSEQVADAASTKFNPAWQYSYLDKADYQVMLTDVDEKDIQLVSDLLKSMVGAEVESDEGEKSIHNPEVYTRGIYADVAVLTVVYKGPRENLIERLTSSQFPRLVMVDEDPDQIILQQVR